MSRRWLSLAGVAATSLLLVRTAPVAVQSAPGAQANAAAPDAPAIQRLEQARVQLEGEIRLATRQVRVNDVNPPVSDSDANAKRSAEEHRHYDDLLNRYSQAVTAELVAKTAGLDPAQRDQVIGQWTTDASAALAQLTGPAAMEVLANAIVAASSDAAKAQAYANLEGSLVIQRIRWQVGRDALNQIALGQALQPQSGQSRRGQAGPDTIARLRQLLNSITAVNVEGPRLASWTLPDGSTPTAAQRQVEEWRRRQERDANIAEFLRLAGTGPVLDSDGNLITVDLRQRIGANAMLQLAEALRASGIEPSTIRTLFGWNDTRTDVGNQLEAGVLSDETFQVLQLLDASTGGGSPQQWARAMAQVIRRGADQVHTYRGRQIPEGGMGGVGGWFYENFVAKRDVGLATISDLIGYNVEKGQEANRTGALAAEDARIDAFEKDADAAVAALNAMASATSPADLTADQRKLLTAFGFIEKGAGGQEVFQIPANADVNAQLQRDLNLPGASMLDMVTAGALENMVFMAGAPQVAAARVGLALQALGASERAVVVGEFIATALANAALDAAHQKIAVGSVQWDRLILDTVVLNTVLPLAGHLTGAASASLAGQIAKNPETKKALEAVVAQSLGLSSDTVLLTYWQGKVSGTGMTYEDFLANAFNGVVMRATPLYVDVVGKPVAAVVTAPFKAGFRRVRSVWDAIRGVNPDFRAELLNSGHTPEEIAAYVESTRFKTQQRLFKEAADRLTSVLGEEYLTKDLADPALIAKVTEAAETGKIGFPDLKAVFGQTPELQALMDGVNAHRLKLFDGIIAKAQQRARAAVNAEYDARATRLTDALAGNEQLKKALVDNETERLSELAKIDEKPKAPGSKNATSDIDRSISSTYLRNELKAVTDEVFRKNRPGADAATSAKAYDVNEYFDIFQIINRMREQKIDLSGVMLNEPGVGNVSQSDAIAAAGLAADMQDMAPEQRAVFKKNRISLGDPARLARLFELAEQRLARNETLLNTELFGLGQQGLNTTNPDVLTRARDTLYGRRAQELAEMEATLARMDVKSDAYKALAARIEREWAYVKLAGIEAYTNFAGLDIIVNKAQMNDITIRELITGKADLAQNGKVNMSRAKKGEPPILLDQRQAMIDRVLGEIQSQYGKEQLGGALDDQIRFIVDHVNLYFEGHESATQAGTALSKYAERSSLLLKLGGADLTQGQLKALDDIAGILVKVRGDPTELTAALKKFGGGNADAGVRKLAGLLSETLPGLKGLFDPAMYAHDLPPAVAGASPAPALSAASLNAARARRGAERRQLWMTYGAADVVNAIAADQVSLKQELQQLEQEKADDARLAADYRQQDFATVRQLEDQANAIEIQRQKLVGRDSSAIRRDLDNQAANVQAQLARVKSYKPAGPQASTAYQQWRDRRITAIKDQLTANNLAALQYAQLAQAEALLYGGAGATLPGGPSVGLEDLTAGPDLTSEHPEFDKMAQAYLRLLEFEGTVPRGPAAPHVSYRNAWSNVPERSEETYVSGDIETLDLKLWDYLNEADFNMSEWKGTKNADGSVTFASSKTGQKVTGRLVTADEVDKVSGQTFKTTRIVVEKPAGVTGSVGANPTGSIAPIVPGRGTSTPTVNASQNAWSKVPERSEETYVSADVEQVDLKLWDYLHDAEFDMSEWKGIKNPDGSVTYTSSKTGQKVTARLVTADEVDKVSGQTFKTTRIVVEKPAGVTGSVGANTTGSSTPIVPLSGAGTLTFDPNRLLFLTPFQGGPTYPGIVGPTGGINLSAPGTIIDPLHPPTPLFVADPVPFPMGGFVTRPDGTVTYTGLNISGLGTPTGASVEPVVNLDPVTGKLVFTDPKKVTDPGSGGIMIGSSSRSSVRPTFAFFGQTSFVPNPVTTPMTTPIENFVIGTGGTDAMFDPNAVPTNFSLPLGATPGFYAFPGGFSISTLGSGGANLGAQDFTLEAVGSTGGPFRPDAPPARMPSFVGAWSARSDDPLVALLRSAPLRAPQNPAAGAGSLILRVVATGASAGEAFTLEIESASGQPVHVVPTDGLIVEPLMAASPATGRATSTQPVLGYCVEFVKHPPAPGTLYRVAAPDVQRRFGAARDVLRAVRRLESLSQLNPDTDPKAYIQALKQWATWTRLEKWGAQQFADHFLARTKQNVEAVGRTWTSQMQSALMQLVPGRWKDISQVLQEADALARQGGTVK